MVFPEAVLLWRVSKSQSVGPQNSLHSWTSEIFVSCEESFSLSLECPAQNLKGVRGSALLVGKSHGSRIRRREKRHTHPVKPKAQSLLFFFIRKPITYKKILAGIYWWVWANRKTLYAWRKLWRRPSPPESSPRISPKNIFEKFARSSVWVRHRYLLKSREEHFLKIIK